MQPLNLHTSIAYLKGVGPARAELLKSELSIHTLQDLLNFFPNRYIDRTQFYKINQLEGNSSEVQLIGKITNLKTIEQKVGSRLVATFSDGNETMELVWFKGVKWIKSNLKLNTPYVIFGRVNLFNGVYNMPHPEMDLLDDFNKSLHATMQPVYPSTEMLSKKGFSNRAMISIVEQLLIEINHQLKESLSQTIINQYQLIPRNIAYRNIHFPEQQELLTKAEFRLKFEELFYIQLQLIRKNILRKSKIKGHKFDIVGHYFNEFYQNHLEFDLTNAQKRVIKEIRKDMGSKAQMNRLLQGDVGSGKTIVALLSMLIALDNGFQAALLAPTEILANQHFQTFSELLKPLNVQIKLLTGSVKTKDRKEIHEELENGKLQILIGTHALFEEKVQFNNLGLAIIDEQHRFGVEQRSKMWRKNEIPPHILIMSATPIPRTLAMSIYGDLDMSVIDEMPPGRKDIKTVHRFDKNRLAVFKFIKDQIEKGRQIYIVYPLIQESEVLDYKDLMDGFEGISRAFPLPKYSISVVHGKLKGEEKDLEMQRFIKKETDIMIATTVIEVGVNVPNASVMVIESAERFGLSQLHQLRGRVGRGAEQSYCILMTGNKLSEDAKTRISTMVNTNNGFEIADVDLKLRGPGNLLGKQQSGVLNLKIADIVKDTQVLKLARSVAFETLQKDANLALPENFNILNTYKEISHKTAIWANIS
ncbi:MAG TPA: ATP-dependent DNA helicase RecG [Flavobacteriaceae bacterium]|nr:ATP-dependent DNA helicase RecG [Flavobacteriaceae bacterium]